MKVSGIMTVVALVYNWHVYMCMVYNVHNLIFYNELISDLKGIAKFVMYSNIKHLDLFVMYA